MSGPENPSSPARASATDDALDADAGEPEPQHDSGYQPALDGVRGIAVSMVVAFHLGAIPGARALGGGWLGVDVFFVLSGYLITSLLLREREQSGRVSMKRFYARRVLRLAPLSVVLVVGCLVGGRFMTSISLPFGGAVAILLYYSNFTFIHDTARLGSLSHCWSLSIEEQFYLVWPTLLVVVAALTRRRSRLALALVAAGGALAIGMWRRHLWELAFAPTTVNGVYFPNGTNHFQAWQHFFAGSIQRPDGLFIGCLMAVLLHGRKPGIALRRLFGLLALVGLVICVATVRHADFPLWTPYVYFIPIWGLSVFNLATAAVVISLVVSPSTWGARALSILPLRWIGRRAYGIYLLHPLVLDVFSHRFDWPTPILVGTILAATGLVAAASYRWLERPFLRRKSRFSVVR